MTTPPLIINIITSLLHVGWCTFFVAKLGLGNTGAGYANAMTWTTQWFLISLYVMRIAPKLGMSRRDVFLPGKGTFQEWGKYLKIAVPCVLQMSSEWWFWEINALLVGFLGTVPLAAHVAANQFIGLSFMPAMGISSAAAALIGNMLGANRKVEVLENQGDECEDWPTDARRYVKAVVSRPRLAGTGGTGKGHDEKDAGDADDDDDDAADDDRDGDDVRTRIALLADVSVLVQSLLVIFAFAGFPDTTQHIMSGALRGMGKMAAGSVVYLLSYYGLMLPTGYALAFKFGYGVRGVWYAFGIGTSTVFSAKPGSGLTTAWDLTQEVLGAEEGGVEFDNYGGEYGHVAQSILGEPNAVDGSWFWALYAYGSFTQEWLRAPSSVDTTDLDTFPHIAWVAFRTATDRREEDERVSRLLGSKPLKES
ncbi:Multidrug and toxin extrusion protein 2 [Symbiodinium microadriaticum]|uniref:Multidrug and toxin extrusion protein 2 n=1 Tax=Symbiodinium microadriaticum TaxID=2951 RepID=A0A1Q9DAU7_SYMMI|nr:Multidrug and toxin extrusion protein 2 [Symbiodinium microadriaticum]